jgi:hypothetical protein
MMTGSSASKTRILLPAWAGGISRWVVLEATPGRLQVLIPRFGFQVRFGLLPLAAMLSLLAGEFLVLDVAGMLRPEVIVVVMLVTVALLLAALFALDKRIETRMSLGFISYALAHPKRTKDVTALALHHGPTDRWQYLKLRGPWLTYYVRVDGTFNRLEAALEIAGQLLKR